MNDIVKRLNRIEKYLNNKKSELHFHVYIKNEAGVILSNNQIVDAGYIEEISKTNCVRIIELFNNRGENE
jgi:hypothetical protein